MSGRLSGEFYRAGAVTGGAPAVFRCVKNTFFSHKMCAFLLFFFLFSVFVLKILKSVGKLGSGDLSQEVYPQR